MQRVKVIMSPIGVAAAPIYRSVTFIAYFAVPQSPGRRVAIHYSFIRGVTIFAWEDARNDCLGPLGESVSGAGCSRERPVPREEQ
jgi:hypothetical protein